MKNLGKFAFVNGLIVPSSKATIHCYDLGLMRGMAVFDFLRFENYQSLFLKDHLDRLFNSAKTFGIPTVFSKDQYTSAICELLKKNKQKDGTLRIILSAGPVTHGFTITAPQVFILVEPYYQLPEKYFEKGVKLITALYKRPFAAAKHTHYSFPGIHDKIRSKSGALELLYIDEDGFVSEPATSNICMIKKGILYTPKSNVLGGVTLKHVLKAAQKLKIKTIIKDFKLKELLRADEIFITATNKDVLPITKIDSHTIANGKPGDLSKKILETYRALTKATN